MGLIVGVLSLLFSAVVSQSDLGFRGLPCQFFDEDVEKVEIMNKAELNYKVVHRNAVLQFYLPEDSPVNSDLRTFLVTAASKKMQQYVKDEKTLECEVRRYRPNGAPRWPAKGATENDSWFTYTLRDTEGHFVNTTFLRHSPKVPNKILLDGQQWVEVAENDIITTTAVMMMSSKHPTVKVALGKEQTLNCEFAIDHKAAHLTVEWTLHHKGQRSKLFSYSSQSGKSEGSGVSLEDIGSGNASLTIPLTTVTSEGKYVCSVQVPPLNGTHNIELLIMEPPRVSLNVDSKVSLSEGELRRVECETKDFYPLDVDVKWSNELVTPSLIQKKRKEESVRHLSHRQHHQDGTYSLTAYFLLQPTLQDSGCQYTCNVSHAALPAPILKSFSLTVTRKDFDLWYIPPMLAVLGIFALLYFALRSRRRRRMLY